MSVISPLVGAIDSALEHVRQPGPADSQRLAAALTDARELALEATRELDRLTMRYIAQLRLYEDLQVERFCDAVADIVVNLIGSEDFVVFLGDSDGDYYPVRGMGPSDEKAVGVASEDPLAARAVAGSAVYDVDGWLALAPMVDPAGRARGLLAIRSLLRHKPSLTDEDRLLLEDVRMHAGRALGWMMSRSGAAV